ALYFTTTTFTTVGYGDITATSEGARVMVIFQEIADIIILGFGVRVLLGAVRIGQARAAGGEQPGTAEDEEAAAEDDQAPRAGQGQEPAAGQDQGAAGAG
ncbi:MAG TPA: ion channel, partial [Acidimicrobiales bacterium]|nr:ion channel [Acidimicrobiales bacterium]